MSKQSNEPREIPIKISISVDQPESTPSSEENKPQTTQSETALRDGAVVQKKCNIVFAPGDRQTEHGLTKIQIVQFADPDQREKILRLFNNPSLYCRLPQLYIYLTGLKNGEQLYYAAETVSKLANIIPFVELKEQVFLLWAKSEDANQRGAAALALRHMCDRDTLQKEVLNLLKHWLTTNNLALNDTALSAYRTIGRDYPDPTLTAIRGAISTKNKILVAKARNIVDIFVQESTLIEIWQMIEQTVYIVDKIYSPHPYKVIDHLCAWLTTSTNQQNVNEELLRYIGAMLFTVIVRLEDLVGRGEENVKDMHKVVDIIFTLWEDVSLPMYEDVYNDTTELVKSWAEQTLRLCTEHKENCQAYRQFFYSLYHRYENHRRNRLDFHLRRWQRLRDMERQRNEQNMAMARRRAEKLGQPVPQNNLDLRGDFLVLIPSD
ncbi:MAG: hypothetical protein KDI79_10990 [Anaerolineae bacterium]|nr:hypothetical protein [Anaerolineae bacterium]